MMLVDAHQHFWRIAEPNRDWPPAGMAALYRDFTPADLLPLLERHDVAATVLVQSMPSETETRNLLDLTERYPQFAAVVGWTDLKAPDAAQRIADLAEHPALRGLRPMLQALEDGWIDDAALDPAIETMIANGLVFDALVLPHQLESLFAFASRFPALPIVIDHAAKPSLAAADAGTWAADLARLAELPNVHCKLSGLVTEAGEQWRTAQLRPAVKHLLRCFGPQRLMWGSDWPVLNLVSGYAEWLAVCQGLTAPQARAEREASFGRNASAFYRLDLELPSAIQPRGLS
jgi:L-fuconolactonase